MWGQNKGYNLTPKTKTGMKNNKLLKLIIGFMLLFPFRLPISILMIKLFNWIVLATGEPIPEITLCTNVIVTKIVYNIIIAIWFIITLWKIMFPYLSKTEIDYYSKIEKTKPTDGLYGILVAMIALMLAFTIIDAVGTYQIFYN